MKLPRILCMLPVVALLAVSPAQAGKGGRPGFGGPPTPVEIAPLSEAEAATLTFMREEEKLARDVYITLHEIWGSGIFSNISRSEQRHMDTMASQLEKYGLPDPVTDDTVGVFGNPALAALYDELVARGEASLEEALHVGGYIEELDIGDLEEAIAESTHADVIRAYENLMRGSRNHLRAFVGQIEAMGVVYEAQVLSQDEVDAIVNSPMERGGKGGGKGRR
ncbi:DUF2202 domain-containing protein [Thiolapillus sp.]